MSSKTMVAFALGLVALASLGCSGSDPAPAAPADTAAPPAAPPPAEPAPAPSATAAASAAPAAPADPMLAGLTGEDLDWGNKCLAGDGSFCTKFGNQGELVAKDFPKALAWYKKGCEASKSKEPVCCMGEARLMIAGQGTTADVDGGLKLWESTCSMDLGRDSCSELAKAYETGSNGVKKNPAKAKAIYAKACDLKSLSACQKAGKKPPKD